MKWTKALLPLAAIGLLICMIGFAAALDAPSHEYGCEELNGSLIDTASGSNFSNINFTGYGYAGINGKGCNFMAGGFFNNSGKPFSGDADGIRAVSFWIYSNGSNDYGIIYDNFDGSSRGDEVIYTGTGFLTWRFHYNSIGYNDWSAPIGSNLTWHHVFFATTSTDGFNYNCTLWIDGVNAATDKTCGYLNSINSPTCIGTGMDGTECTQADYLNNIRLDELVAWVGKNTNDTFYSADDALWLYNNGTGRHWNGISYVPEAATNATLGAIPQQCPSTASNQLLIAGMILVGLAAMLLGFMHRQNILGILGSLFTIFMAFYVFPCIFIVGLIICLTGTAMFMHFALEAKK